MNQAGGAAAAVHHHQRSHRVQVALPDHMHTHRTLYACMHVCMILYIYIYI